MDFSNTTDLDSTRLENLFLRHTWPYRHEGLRVRVRYSRQTDFSGTCFYREARIFLNLGRRVVYPYRLGTHIARSQANRTHWWRETYRLVIADAYQLALFVYLHELYHFLVKVAGRNPRRKEAMCDRFAAGVLVDHCAVPVLGADSAAVARDSWDFQDLHAFVAGAPKSATRLDLVPAPRPRPIPVTIAGVRTETRRA